MPNIVQVTAVPAVLVQREEGAAALQRAAPLIQRARKGEYGNMVSSAVVQLLFASSSVAW